MLKTIEQVDKECILRAIPPTYGKTYTVIEHKFIIQTAENAFDRNHLKVKSEKFRRTGSSNIVNGWYTLDYQEDPQYETAYAFTNSYNKQKRFESAIGVIYKVKAKNTDEDVYVPVIKELNAWKRKHTGSADQEAYEEVNYQIDNFKSLYRQTMEDLNLMKEVTIDSMEYCHIIGELFGMGLLSSTQLNLLHSEHRNKKLQEFRKDSLFDLYIETCWALTEDHPQNYMKTLSETHSIFLNHIPPHVSLVETDSSIECGEVEELPTAEKVEELPTAEELEEQGYHQNFAEVPDGIDWVGKPAQETVFETEIPFEEEEDKEKEEKEEKETVEFVYAGEETDIPDTPDMTMVIDKSIDKMPEYEVNQNTVLFINTGEKVGDRITYNNEDYIVYLVRDEYNYCEKC
jgi:hypothetical protein